MEYLVRFAQVHETFRKPELEALAVVANVQLEILKYNPTVRYTLPAPFLVLMM
jgi:tRNA G10  N-methylase Trm11